MASGRVCTGYSYPLVALYNHSGSTVSYSNGMELARGVDVNIEATSSEDNSFHVNNGVGESSAGKFSTGTLNLTVDGMKAAASKLVFGLPEADTKGFTAYGDKMVIPYVGFGCVKRYQSDGVTSYEPAIVPKVRFSVPADAAKTQEENIEWQTQQLTAAIHRDDTADHNWKYVGKEYPTEAEALAAAKQFLNFA